MYIELTIVHNGTNYDWMIFNKKTTFKILSLLKKHTMIQHFNYKIIMYAIKSVPKQVTYEHT